MIQPKPGGAGDKFVSLDIRSLTGGGPFREVEFRAALRAHDWEQYTGKRVLVKACAGSPLPPWAFMALVAQLIPKPITIAYGEECDPIVIFKQRTEISEPVQQYVSGDV